jgi:drug/metabolite transporter (DMT)-like permease
MTPPGRRQVVGVAAALGVLLAFSSFVLVSRAGLTTAGLSPADVLALRFAVAGLVLSPYCLWVGGMPPFRHAVLLALTGGLGFSALAYAGLALAPASHGSALIHGALPLMTVCLSAAVWRRRPSGTSLVCSAVILAGAVSLIAASFTQGRTAAGDALLLLASLAWSAYALTVRALAIAPLRAAGTVVTVSALIYLPLYAGWGEPARLLAVAPGELLVQALVQGVLVGVCSVWFYGIATTNLGAPRTAAIASAAPAIVALGSVVWLGETLPLAAVVSVTLILAGSFFSAILSG